VTTTTTSFTESVLAEMIEERVQNIHLPQGVFVTVADVKAVPAGSGQTVRLLRQDSISAPVAGVKTEDAEFNLVEHTLSEATASVGTVGYSARPTYELIADSSIDVLSTIINSGMRLLANRVDVDGLALLSSLVPIASYAGLPLTDQRVIAALATYHATNPNDEGQMPCIVLNHIQIRDWTSDLAASGAGYLGGDAESNATAKLIGPARGFKGVKHGLAVFMSTNVPVSGGDASGGIFPMGDGSPLAIRSWRGATVEIEKIPRRQSVEITISNRYGVTVSDTSNGVEVLSDGA
jgi:hypothetical protein